MTYTPLSNYKYDSGPHRIQSGPNYEGFVVVSSGIQNSGADLGIITEGAPNSGLWFQTDDWRSVPRAVSGYWTDYTHDVAYEPSGSLDTYVGYRSISSTTVAGVKTQTATTPDYGVRSAGKYLYYGGKAPDGQVYTPFNTPEGNTAAEGYTGGGVTHRNYEGAILTNDLGSQGTANRSEWKYNPPVYCKTYTETVRSQAPGLMSTPLRFIYRGGSSRYVSNYGSVYYQSPESVRGLIRPFSSSVNVGNQPNV